MITARQMKELEEYAAEQGIKASDLMENAGKAVFETVREKYDLDGKRIVVFCGPGNNGGDGFVAARYFAGEFPTLIFFFGEKSCLSEESLENYEKVRKKVNIIPVRDKKYLEQFQFQEGLEFVFIDALLGTGVKGGLREPISFAIDFFNSLPGLKIAVDIPSGLDPDTGGGEKVCQVDLIVCFHELKIGLEKYRRKTVVVDIGIPKIMGKIIEPPKTPSVSSRQHNELKSCCLPCRRLSPSR